MVLLKQKKRSYWI